MTDEIPHRPSRRTLLRSGLLAGLGTAVVGIAAPVLTGTGTARAAVSGTGTQFGWAWCDKCMGLFFEPFQSSSWCPAPQGGQHDGSESYTYYLLYGYSTVDIGGQDGWAWCDKCMGLFYGPFQSSSWCPAPQGGQHDGSESYNYNVPSPVAGVQPPNGTYGITGWQDEWLWCDKCQGQFYGPFQGSSWCPGGGRHDGSESANYTIYYIFG